MEQGVLLGMLSWYALEDIRKHAISVGYLPLFAAAGVGLKICFGEASLWCILPGIAVGIAMLGLSALTRGSIGMGDGLLLAVTGIFLGGAGNVELLLTGLLYAAFFSLGILLLGKKRKQREIPFVPFLLLAYVTILWMDMG